MMETPYLCVMYLATAGQQGNLLGADEEEVVLLVYVVIDMAKNQVVGIHQFLVKPRAADINENVLSEQIVADSRLTEDMVKNGQSLETAIMQFEHYVKSTFHIGPSPHSLRLITDGQLPLRQCLHPEATTKTLELPAYYAVFHDLRKEFKQFYSSTEEMTSIQDMVTYLGMTPNSSNDYFVSEIKDMVDIVQRLIADGNKFETPETVNLRLEPGICSKDEEVDNNCVVRARGLPWQSSDQDIAKFFRGLNVAKGGVALCLSPQGRRNGEALVRFVNQEHRDMALKRHKHHIGNRYIEVYKASGDDFINVAGGNNNEAQAFLSRGAQVIVRMRGLPYDCTAKQVLEFFDAGENTCKVMDEEEGVLFVKKPDGRATGDAFVLFGQEDDSYKALSKHRELIGSRYIELFRSTTAEVQQVLNRSMDPKTYEQQQPLIAQIPQVPLLPQHIITSGTRKDCIRLRGLPYEAQVEHILDFLGEHAKSIVFQGVHMVYNAQGQPSGEAFIQMDSEHSAYVSASQKHHRYMIFGKKQRYIEVFQCSGEDMNLVLTGGLPAAGAVSPAAKAAATLLSPGMLAGQPALGPPPQLFPDPSYPMAQQVAQQVHAHQAQQALVQQVHQNLAMRQSQHENLMFLNQIAVAQQHQAAVAAAINAANSKNSWPEITSLDSPEPSPPSSSSSQLAIMNNSSVSIVNNTQQTVVKQNGAQYGALVNPYGGPPPANPGQSMFLLNMAQRMQQQQQQPLLSQPPPGTAYHPRVPPPQIPSHPPPPHGMLPHHLLPAGLMGMKRSWEQAFPGDLQQAGFKRQWPPQQAMFHPQGALAHPALAYQNAPLQFYPAM